MRIGWEKHEHRTENSEVICVLFVQFRSSSKKIRKRNGLTCRRNNNNGYIR